MARVFSFWQKNKFIGFIIPIIALGLAFLAPAQKSQGASQDNAFVNTPFSVAILPNEVFDHGKTKKLTASSIAASKVDFVIFTGDTKDGGSVCSDQVIGPDLKNYFDALKKPVLYSLGDNEWTDCHRTSNGGYDPLERLSFLRKFFFNKPYTQGLNPIPVQRQGQLGGKFSENSRFIYHNVMFVALHVVGSNNNLVSSDKLCHKKSKRTQADCDKASAEYRERNKANIEWLKQSFALARKKYLKGIAIVIQADIYTPFDVTHHGYKKFLKHLDDKNGFTDFFKTLVAETHNFDGQVALIHGDSHVFQFDKAMFNPDQTITSNFWRIETFGAREQSWVKLDVDPCADNVFKVTPIILPPLPK